MENCNECKWVNMTEEEQTDNKNPHICTKYKVQVCHRSRFPRMHHDYIFPCCECNGKDFEQR